MSVITPQSDADARADMRRRRLLLSIGVLLLIAAATGWLLSGGPDDDGPSPTAMTSTEPASDAVITWQDLYGFSLPVSSVDGPSCVTTTRAACFGHNQSGAALAAAHILVRTFAFPGPSVFTAAISTQVVGANTEALRRVTNDAYQDSASASGVTAPQPLPVTGGWMAGFRVEPTNSSDSAVVRLLVRDNGGGEAASMVEFRVHVEWHHGDWRVVAPDWGDWSTASTPLADARPDEYRSFDDLGRPARPETHPNRESVTPR